MKLTDQFDLFLEGTVNLNQTRIDTLKSCVESIKSFLSSSNYSANIKKFLAQGSWAHKTIIKPVKGKEFDADLVMFIQPFNGWAAKDYVNELWQIFKNSDRYKDKMLRGTRCVVVNYAEDFHLDIIPCIVDRQYSSTFEVCNRNEDRYELTASEAYTDWLSKRNFWTGNDMLRDVTKLLKYLRDIKKRFSVKSILLTTLLGNEVDYLDSFSQETHFSDLPTSLRTLMGRLDDYLQDNPKMPEVQNPVLTNETFTRHWDDIKYANFRDCIHRYREWIDDAYDETDRNESIRKWRMVFGEQFAKSEVRELACFSESSLLLQETGYQDIVRAAMAMGAGFLNKLIPFSLPHVEKLPWKMKSQPILVIVSAREYPTRNVYGQPYQSLSSGDVIDKFREVRYEAQFHNSYPASSTDFIVKWQVVNTDKEAIEWNQLRGDFYNSHEPGVRWESTKYKGAHWVQAFVILKRTNECWGKSDRFFVVIR